jgi:hypothetical protein
MCSVMGCNNEAFGKLKVCADCGIWDRPPDVVVVSEYEAYQAWLSIDGRPKELGLNMDILFGLSTEELASALFGYWNAVVRQ